MFRSSHRRLKSAHQLSNAVIRHNHLENLEQRRLFSGITGANELAATTFSAVGTANVTTKIASYLTAIGGAANGVTPSEQPSGSRRIVWDAVKLDGTDFGGLTKTIVPNKVVGIPINRFQTNGALFGEVYAVAGDGFASVNPGVAGQINAFSLKNTFGHFNDIDIDQSFIKPSAATTAPVQQATRGFGAVFLDVERANDSYIEYFNGDDSLGKYFVPVGASGQPEFMGVLFNSAIVTNVEIHPGSSSLFFFNHGHTAPGQADLSNGGTEDMSAVDDFVYAEPAAISHPTVNHLTEGKSFTGTFGKFTTTNVSPKASDFTAKVTFGDNTAAVTGTVVGSGTNYTINASHTYAEEGSYTVTVTITDLANHTSTSRSLAVVADAPLTASAVNFNAAAGEPFHGTVAKFKDANLLETDATSFNALIDWGDGSSSIGQILNLGSGNWAVRGNHQYANTGTFNVKVAIADEGGSTASATSKATVI